MINPPVPVNSSVTLASPTDTNIFTSHHSENFNDPEVFDKNDFFYVWIIILPAPPCGEILYPSGSSTPLSTASLLPLHSTT